MTREVKKARSLVLWESRDEPASSTGAWSVGRVQHAEKPGTEVEPVGVSGDLGERLFGQLERQSGCRGRRTE